MTPSRDSHTERHSAAAITPEEFMNAQLRFRLAERGCPHVHIFDSHDDGHYGANENVFIESGKQVFSAVGSPNLPKLFIAIEELEHAARKANGTQDLPASAKRENLFVHDHLPLLRNHPECMLESFTTYDPRREMEQCRTTNPERFQEILSHHHAQAKARG